MDFNYSEENQALMQEVRQFFAKEWPQENRNWRGWEAPDTEEFIKEATVLNHKMAANGWLGLSYPTEYGGSGRLYQFGPVLATKLPWIQQQREAPLSPP